MKVTVPRTGKFPVAFVMLPTGDVMTNPAVPDTAPIADSMSDMLIVPPGEPLARNTPEIAADTALRVVAFHELVPVSVKLTVF
ncbi:hypothetical protein AQ712_12965 [Burkholderia pseudomallei]|nr:hypothetical protein AQ712_12965 [Burkholderia pseudomallei]